MRLALWLSHIKIKISSLCFFMGRVKAKEGVVMRVSIFAVTFVLLSFVFSGQACALSCVELEGDQVQALGNTKQPLWFGTARLVQITKNEDGESSGVVGKFELIDSYLNTSKFELERFINVNIDEFMLTWGPWSSYEANQEKIENKEELRVVLSYKHGFGWSYSGPGACTYFSDKEWNGLKSGYYDDKISKDDEEK
ncbi:MAG: hypothetical protein R3E13_02260 [Alphaproteobacteria bacterium]